MFISLLDSPNREQILGNPSTYYLFFRPPPPHPQATLRQSTNYHSCHGDDAKMVEPEGVKERPEKPQNSLCTGGVAAA